MSPENLARIADLSEGGYRNAETLLEQVVVGGVSLDLLSFSSSEFVEVLSVGQQKEALEFVDHLARDGESISAFNQSLILYLRNLLLILGGVGDDVLDIGDDNYKNAKRQAEKLGKVRLIYFITRFLEAEEQSKFSPVPQLPLELAVFDAVASLTNKTSQLKAEDGDGEDGLISNDEEDLENDSKGAYPDRQEGGLLPDSKGNIKLTLEEVSKKWEDLLKAVKPYNHSLEALLRSCRPKEVSTEGTLFIEVFYRFHKDRLSAAGNAGILGKVMNVVFGCTPAISYVLVEKKREPAKVPSLSGSSEDLVSAALEAFGA